MIRYSKLQTGAFARNLLAYGMSEGMAKGSRIFVIIAVARFLDPVEIGLAAAALSASEILKSLTENGATQRIIAARDEDLDAVCNTAHRIFWTWCCGLFVLQALLALCLYLLTSDPVVPALICLLAVEYLFMPGGLVNCALAMREGKLTGTAGINAAQVVSANLISALMAVIWPSPLVIVLPKVLTAPIWLVGMRRLRCWDRKPDAGRAPLKPFVRFGAGVLGVEIVKASRLHADKLVVGGLLGAEALGIYFFAFNAGLGIANSFTQAFSTVLFPHLCAAQDRASTLVTSLKLAFAVMVPVVLIQAILAPVYVPLLFGEQWSDASGIVSILCLAAIPGLLWSASAQWLRVHERTGAEFTATAVCAAGVIAFSAITASEGLYAVAFSYLAVVSVVQVSFAWPALRTVFTPNEKEA